MKQGNNIFLYILSMPYLLFHYVLTGILFLLYLIFCIFKYVGMGLCSPFLFLYNILNKKDNVKKEEKKKPSSKTDKKNEAKKNQQLKIEKKAEEKRKKEEEKKKAQELIKKKKEEKKQKKEKKNVLKEKMAMIDKKAEKKLELENKKLQEKNKREKEAYDRKMAIINKKKEAKLKIEKEKLAKLEEKRKKEEEARLKKEAQNELKEQQELLKDAKEAEGKKKSKLFLGGIASEHKEKTSKEKKLEERERLKKEAAKRKEELKREKKKLQEKNTYINENAEIEKKGLGDYINDGLEYLIKGPKKLYLAEKKRIENNAILKNKRNEELMKKEAILIDLTGEDAEKSDKKVVYEYTGKTAEGKVVRDYFDAFSKVEVHSFLLSEGFEVYSIKTNYMIQLLHSNRDVKKGKVKNKDLIFFLTQLSTYIKAGIPLVEALRILSRQFKEKSYEKIFRSMIYELTMGDNFSDAMGKQGDAFPRILVNMIKASEMTGVLPETLDDMADYFNEMEKTKKQMITALTYPMLIMVLAIAALVFIMMYIVPQFVTIYEDMDNAELPWITVFVLSISTFLQEKWLPLIITIVLTVATLIWLFKNVRLFKTMVQWGLMKLPIIGDVIIFNEVTMFTKTFASLLKHNVFITDSMEILNKITNNEIWKMIILDTVTNLAKGDKISLAFQDHWAVPIPAYEMIVTGERTGQLPEMMQKVSDYYQEMHKNQVGRIKAFVEPILIIFLTGAVGLIVMSIIIPMFGMYSNLS